MTKKQINNLDYLAALKILQAHKVKNINNLVLAGAAEVKKQARSILRNLEKITIPCLQCNKSKTLEINPEDLKKICKRCKSPGCFSILND